MTTLTRSERDALRAIQFDAALEAYACGHIDAEAVARAAGQVVGSTIPLDPDDARAIARLTGAVVKLLTYDDAGRAVQRWFAAMEEAGVRY